MTSYRGLFAALLLLCMGRMWGQSVDSAVAPSARGEELYKFNGLAAPGQYNNPASALPPRSVQMDSQNDTKTCVDRWSYAMTEHGLASGCDYVRSIWTLSPEALYAFDKQLSTLGGRQTLVLAFRGNNSFSQ